MIVISTLYVQWQTEVDDGDSGVLRSDDERVDDRLDEVENELPVVDTA